MTRTNVIHVVLLNASPPMPAPIGWNRGLGGTHGCEDKDRNGCPLKLTAVDSDYMHVNYLEQSMAKAFLISPEDKSIESIELSDVEDVASLVGFDTIESDDIGNGGDRLFFDEECFIRGASGRFQIDKLIPVAGKGIVVGVSADGAKLTDVAVDQDELLKRTRFE